MSGRPSQESLGGRQGAVAALLLANALLAFGPMFVRLADVGPVASAFWRMALALPLLAGVTMAVERRNWGVTPALLVVILASGLLFAADLASWHLGIVRTKAANATLFGNSASFIFPLYGFVVARSWPSRRQGFALLLALAGTLLLMGRSADLSPDHLLGDLLSFLAGGFYALYFIAIARARETMAPLPLITLSTAASALPLLLIAVALGEPVWPGNWWPLVALALFSQVLGQGLMTRALGVTSPLVIGLALLVQPIVAAGTGWVVFDETLGLLDFVGAALVGLALILVRQPASKA